jgi:hypothetical protein
MEIEELIKIIVFVAVLVVMIGATIYFFGGGSDLLGSIKNLMRFGR